jgi:hypothetical protein
MARGYTNIQSNKLSIVKPSVQVWHSSFSYIWKEEVMRTVIAHQAITDFA